MSQSEILIDAEKPCKILSLSGSDCDCNDCNDCNDCGDCQCGDAGDGSGSGDW